MSTLNLRLFGAPEVSREGSPLSFDTRKAVALLAFLAVSGRAQRRESLATLLWPESDQSRARASLRRTLSAAGGTGLALLVRRGEIELDPRQVWCDVTEFERLAAADDGDALRQASELATGPFLDGFSLRDSAEFDDWSAATSERLREKLVSVLARLASLESAAGQLDGALDFARRWVELDPLSEGAHRELMRLYAWTGQRPSALKQYRQCVRSLDRELGVAPLPETTELYDDIRANRLEAHPNATPPVEVAAQRDSGRQATASAHPLVGRESVTASLLEQWRQSTSDGGSAVLVGAPGLGRTSLAAHLRSTVANSGGATIALRGHVAELDLAYAAVVDLTKALTNHDPALADPLATMGHTVESPGQRVRLFDLIRDSLSKTLSGNSPGLLLVDDAHWLDSTSFDLVGYLLRRPPPGVLVLATLRNDAFESSRLDEVGSVTVLRPWDAYETEKALATLGSRTTDPAEAYRRTGGNPRLVVEYVIATQEEGSSPLGHLHDQAGTRLDLAPAPTRQTLGAAAVIGTVADPDLIRHVSGRDEVETVQALEDAVSRGLLVEDSERNGYDFPYDALRDLVLARIGLARLRLLNGRAADALIRRHAATGTQVPAARVARHLARAGREPEAHQWFWSAAQTSTTLYAHSEALGHLRSALALGHDPAATHAATGDALTALGRYDDALVAYEQAAAATSAAAPNRLAVTEHKLAEVHDRLGDWEVARAHLESAAELLQTSGELAMRAQVAADLALVSYRQGDPGAGSVGEEALQMAEASGDTVSLSQAMNVLGVLALGRGESADAAQYLDASLVHARAAGSTELQVAALNNLARMHAQDGHVDEALRSAEEALDLGLAHGDLHRVAALHDHLADLLHLAGRESAAMEHLKAAVAAFGAVDESSVRPEIWKLVAW